MFDRILVVCTGNHCRSPLAERCLRQLMPEKKIDSAGTRALVNQAADARAVRVAGREGLSLAGHKGQPFTPELGYQYDLILVMEQQHRREIERMAPALKGKIMLFGHWLQAQEIADPYGQDEAAYLFVYRQIRRGAGRWAEKLSS
ncbi:TPA: protein tyrosine phosphatase [Salmonella enterica]|uniref:protein-tyrosine-phosphatase n=1 Tax=Salmonella enterica TaxID=28901 RepID=A0A747XJ40_SALER|nr:protein tyrosine phosphatase [Salmonella enterica]HAF4697574.1 protein tyrosine phosphatase [Salmonella enterica]